jgi:hypothetical protein
VAFSTLFYTVLGGETNASLFVLKGWRGFVILMDRSVDHEVQFIAPELSGGLSFYRLLEVSNVEMTKCLLMRKDQ